MVLRFTKMHGLGNDFVVIDQSLQNEKISMDSSLAKRLADRRLGVGCDQVVLVEGRKVLFWNADGSEAELCGNGMRAVGLFLHQAHQKDWFEVETKKGKQIIQFHSKDEIEVNLGAIDLGTPEEIQIKDQNFVFQSVNIGNPHAVVFVESLGEEFVCEYGSIIEKHSRFPNRTNVEFVKVLGPRQIEVEVWERGAGYTQACGSGACAAAASMIALNGGKSPMQVKMPGGTLQVKWVNASAEVFLVGPARAVFNGEIDLNP